MIRNEKYKIRTISDDEFWQYREKYMSTLKTEHPNDYNLKFYILISPKT